MKYIVYLFLMGSIFFFACEDSDSPQPNIVLSYSFASDVEGWEAGFADYPEGEDQFYELNASFATLPAPLDTVEGAFFISGNNHSDDLFMFIKRKIDGLEPSSLYEISFQVQLASSYPENSVGIGGSPGASVYIKAGAVPIEPLAILPPDETFLFMNIDKGNQSEGGKDMDVVGTVGIPGDEFEYQLIERENEAVFKAETNGDGELWLIIGTDSGFEGTSSLYYDEISVQLKRVE